MKVKTEQLKEGTVMMSGETIARVHIRHVNGSYRKVVECVIKRKKNDTYRKAFYDFGNTIYIKSL